jgi:hypothetical protein
MVKLLTRPIESPSMSCPFCSLPPDRIVAANTAGWTVRDAYPVSPGHISITCALRCFRLDLSAFLTRPPCAPVGKSSGICVSLVPDSVPCEWLPTDSERCMV